MFGLEIWPLIRKQMQPTKIRAGFLFTVTSQERLPAGPTLSPPRGRTSSTHITFLSSGDKPLQSRHAAAPRPTAPHRSQNSSDLSNSSLQLHNTESPVNTLQMRCEAMTCMFANKYYSLANLQFGILRFVERSSELFGQYLALLFL